MGGANIWVIRRDVCLAVGGEPRIPEDDFGLVLAGWGQSCYGQGRGSQGALVYLAARSRSYQRVAALSQRHDGGGPGEGCRWSVEDTAVVGGLAGWQVASRGRPGGYEGAVPPSSVPPSGYIPWNRSTSPGPHVSPQLYARLLREHRQGWASITRPPFLLRRLQPKRLVI